MATQKATLAAGCFWGVEKCFQKKFGTQISGLKVGYIGGTTSSVNYRQVCTGATGHAEAIQFDFNPAVVPYSTILDFFFRMHDPTTKNKQGGDAGSQYRSAIFYHSPEQQKEATETIQKYKSHFGSKGISTTVEPATKWFDGEDYHQAYLEKNPHGYECSTHFERSWERIQELYK